MRWLGINHAIRSEPESVSCTHTNARGQLLSQLQKEKELPFHPILIVFLKRNALGVYYCIGLYYI